LVINRALTSVSVASVHVQLVRRWIEQGRVDRRDAMLESLRISEQALRTSAATIRELQASRAAGPTTASPGED
jgi:hypothetical protein